MPDESSRSAPPPGQRRSDGAPAWWASLERSDLPDDGRGRARPAEPAWYEQVPAPQSSIRTVSGMEGMPTRRRAWLINVAAVLVAVVVIMLGLGVDSPRSALLVGLLFGVPAVLVAVTAGIAARRAR